MRSPALDSEGVFEAIVVSAKRTTIGAKSTPVFQVMVQVTQDGPEKDSVAWWKGWMTERGLEHTEGAMRNFAPDDWSGDLDSLDLTNRACLITTERDGKWLNVKRIVPFGDKPDPIKDDEELPF
jgi:hypothetical protein